MKHPFAQTIFVTLVTALSWLPNSQADAVKCNSFFNQSEAWHSHLDFSQTEIQLQNGEIVSIRRIDDPMAANALRDVLKRHVYLVTFDNGLMAVFKPRLEAAQWEVAAYKLARWLGLSLIPPTIAREINGQIGSLQLYVSKASRKNVVPNPIEMNERQMFAFVFGQWDLHPGNIIVDDAGGVAMIDNELIRMQVQVQYGSLPFIGKLKVKKAAQQPFNGESFPFHKPLHFENPTREEFWQYLKDYVDELPFNDFWRWREQCKDNTMKVIIWNNRVYIQSIGYANYGPTTLTAPLHPERLQKYKELNLATLRALLPDRSVYYDELLLQWLARRDQVLFRLAQQTDYQPASAAKITLSKQVIY